MKLLGALLGATFWVACCMAGSSGTTLRLAWDASPDTNVIGYYLLWGTTSGNYSWRTNVGNVTEFSLPQLEEGKTFYFVVTAFDENLVESDPSNEISYEVPVARFQIQPVPQSRGSLVSVFIPVEPGHRYVLQATEDFRTWTSVWWRLYPQSNRTDRFMDVIQSTPGGSKQRFYRLLTY